MTNRLRLALSSLVAVLAVTSSGGPGLGARQNALRGADGRSTTQLPDGSMLVLGGSRQSGAIVVYDPATRASRPAARLRFPRSWHTATVLPDGSVLIAGGIGADEQLVPEVERFDPASGELTIVEAAGFTARARHTATLLTDGRILFSGGETPGGGGVRAELWDFVTNAAEPVSGPPHERIGGVAELLADGTVRLSGGTTATRGTEPEPEIFDPDLSVFDTQTRRPAASATAAVSAVLPADGSEEVSPAARIALRFSAPVDPRSLTITLETVDEDVASAVPASIVTAEGGRLAFVTPAATLAPGAVYRVTVQRARTASGRRLRAFSSRFRTARPPDLSDPAGIDDDDPADQRRALESPWRKLPPLLAPRGVTALAGQALKLNGLPLANVTIEIDRRRVRTDRTGRFLMRLGSAPSGWREMLIDGRTANRRTRTYGVFETVVQIKGGKTVPLPYTIWMPALDTANAVRIASPTTTETVITTPHIPGLELHLPLHTVITDHDGKVVREVSITPIPVDRPPFPLPTGVDVPVYFTIQPGGAYVAVKSYGSGRKGAWLVYPNYTQQPAGSEHQFWHYDPEAKGWHVYGMGRVEPSGRQVVPNPDVALYEFTGAMINTGQTPGTENKPGPKDGDPVVLSTGMFVMDKADLVVHDVIPLVLSRTYYSSDSGSRPFGIGSTHPYAMFLWSANEFQEVDLVLPDGTRIHYVRTSPGTGFTDAAFAHTTTPTAFYQSTIVWNGAGWDLRLRDGTVYEFGMESPLQAIRDRFGNTVRLTWSQTNVAGDGYGNILKVTSPNGRWIAFTYDGSNRIIEATDNLNRTVEYEYDASGRVWKVTDARGGVTEYSYDIAHRMLSIQDPRNIVYLDNEYDVNGRVEKQTQADGGEFAFAYTVNGSGLSPRPTSPTRGGTPVV